MKNMKTFLTMTSVKRSLSFCLLLLLSFSFPVNPLMAVPPAVPKIDPVTKMPIYERREGPFDHSTWDRFLKKFVNENGEVDYTGVQKDPALLHQYLGELSEIESYFEITWLREEILALFLNLYHAAVILAVVEHYPVKTLNDVPGIWDIERVRIGPYRFSINQIYNEKLIEEFRDEKIHLALSCGAEDCPKLSRDAFTGPQAEGQLFLATRQYVNNRKYVDIRIKDKKAFLSRTFLWHASDFTLDFGVMENDRNLPVDQFSVLSFIYYYLEDAEAVEFLNNEKYKIAYLPFDWSLNDWKPDAA